MFFRVCVFFLLLLLLVFFMKQKPVGKTPSLLPARAGTYKVSNGQNVTEGLKTLYIYIYIYIYPVMYFDAHLI